MEPTVDISKKPPSGRQVLENPSLNENIESEPLELLPSTRSTLLPQATVLVKFFEDTSVEIETENGHTIPDGRFEKALYQVYWALGQARAAFLQKSLRGNNNE